MPFGHAPVSSRARRLRRIIFQFFVLSRVKGALSPPARGERARARTGGRWRSRSPVPVKGPHCFRNRLGPWPIHLPWSRRRAEVSNLNGRPSIRFQGGAGPWPVYSPRGLRGNERTRISHPWRCAPLSRRARRLAGFASKKLLCGRGDWTRTSALVTPSHALLPN